MKLRSIIVVSALLVFLCACGAAPEPADLVIKGGRIVTMDPDRPEAEAVAVRGQHLVAVGGADEVSKLVGEGTEVIELDGALAVPGLIEGHGHFTGLGRSKMILDLTQAASFEEIVAMVDAAARGAAPDEWILGRGWHQEKWLAAPEPNFAGLPYHDLLSGASRPIAILPNEQRI